MIEIMFHVFYITLNRITWKKKRMTKEWPRVSLLFLSHRDHKDVTQTDDLDLSMLTHLILIDYTADE